MATVEEVEAESNPEERHEGQALVELMVELGPGKEETITVYQDDNPEGLAKAFCHKHNLNSQNCVNLVRRIQSALDVASPPLPTQQETDANDDDNADDNADEKKNEDGNDDEHESEQEKQQEQEQDEDEDEANISSDDSQVNHNQQLARAFDLIKQNAVPQPHSHVESVAIEGLRINAKRSTTPDRTSFHEF